MVDVVLMRYGTVYSVVVVVVISTSGDSFVVFGMVLGEVVRRYGREPCVIVVLVRRCGDSYVVWLEPCVIVVVEMKSGDSCVVWLESIVIVVGSG